jgi:DNA helicase-2/ATP-dependent DNA helicase PcrA
VFVVGVEDGLLPHARSLGTTPELEEERRLAYVALTRAQQRLYLSFAQARESNDGPADPHRPSRFLSALPRETWQLQRC